jgi:hypothetical protein
MDIFAMRLNVMIYQQKIWLSEVWRYVVDEIVSAVEQIMTMI